MPPWAAPQTDDEPANRLTDSLARGLASARDFREVAAAYLTQAKGSRGLPHDPVARFPLGNGAQIYAVHADADLSFKGTKQSSGAMVHYQYDLALIEFNHEQFSQHQKVCTAPGVMASPAWTKSGAKTAPKSTSKRTSA